MLKLCLSLLLGAFLVACSASVGEPVLVETTIAPEVTITIENLTDEPVTLLASSNIGATVRVDGAPLVNRLKLAEIVIQPGESFTHSWGDITEAIAISGYVELEIEGEIVRMNATF